MIINIALCDDNKESLNSYSTLIKNIKTKYQLNITLFENGNNLLDVLETNANFFNVIILDVEMPYINGIELSKKIRDIGYRNEIIFLTDFIDYAFEAFDSYPLQYLHKKNLSNEKLEDVLKKSFALQDKKQSEVFTATMKGETKIIPYSKIYYFEAQGRYINIYYESNKKFEFISTINDLETKLPKDRFTRVHRSYIINLLYLESFQIPYLRLKNEKMIPIGITRVKYVKEKFSEYLMKEMDIS